MGTREAIQQLREVYADGRAICDRSWEVIPPQSLEEAFESMACLVPAVLARTGTEALKLNDKAEQLMCLIKGTVYTNRVIERAIKTLEEIPDDRY